ncbi:MAG: VOC family protein [Pseudomonadota bacterium]
MKAVINLLILVSVVMTNQTQAIETIESANISDTETTIIGVNQIGLSVKNLDDALDFYQRATGFELISRKRFSNSVAADTLFAHKAVEVEVATLKAPNMLFELMAFSHNEQAPERRMPAFGPGMTHTCFQSPLDQSGWDKFIKAGAEPLTRGGQPIDLGGYGVTYGYAYDPEGNMMELEQLDADMLRKAKYDNTWKDIGHSMWMSQVALVSHDIERLMQFYQKVLGISPYRTAELVDNVKAGLIADIDDLHLLGGWFRMNERSKVIELWQYLNPLTAEFSGERRATDLGYSFALEVEDIQAEYQRMVALGVDFVSAPTKLDGSWQAYARDIDGNIFSIRQFIDVNSPYSVRVLDKTIEQ